MLLKSTSVLAALAALVALAFSSEAAAQQTLEGDPERGRALGETCMGCHGIPGYRNAYPSFRVPKLGGQKTEYIVMALTEYRDGTRPHPTMHAQASVLDDQAIADIAAWVTQAGTATADVDAQTPGLPEAATTCIACHGKAGANMLPTPPIISGQHRDYLVHALGQYKDGVRSGTVMTGFAAPLTKEQIEQITTFYSSRDGLDTLGQQQ